MMVSNSKYENHTVFGEFDRYIEFYKLMAHSVFPWISIGTKAIYNIDTNVFTSIQGTLMSIRAVLQDSRINDAYALLRKYNDAVVINIYSNLFLSEHINNEDFVVEQIENWLQGKKRLPEYRIMSQYIRCSAKVAPITALLFVDDRYKRLRDRCNDHTHYNFYSNVLLNDCQLFTPDRAKALDEFLVDVRDVFILHIAYLFFAKEHYMMSSDYLDHLECGMTPKAGSEYWVAPFVQDVFSQIIEKYRPDIALTIREHTSMRLA